ncbi:MAG: hypothetical protein A2Y70_03010 [Candidatus Aminicenantes bacterium RBG_13_64_14]|nr:MAG: hypothetical protein A2Y70_03010 [Candidatus Aminicenantes bacterium RBG_13_64_14]
MSPYPNEHACRLQDPDTVKVRGSITRKHGAKSFRILIGRREGKTTSEAQAYRYPKDEWPADEARAHCKEAGGSFEAAARTQEMTAEEALGPDNPMLPELEEE